MKIFEYRPNCGSFSLGFETFRQNEVVEVVNLAKNAEFAYNKTHKQWFLPNFSSIATYEPENSFDLAIMNPNIGDNIAKKGKNNFRKQDLLDCLEFLRRIKPEFAVFPLEISAVPLLNISDRYVRDANNQLSCDIIIESLQKMGYDAYLCPVDVANYGIPTHREFAFYIATPKDYHLKFPKGLFNEYGRGQRNKFRTIADALSDLDKLGEWVNYKTTPQNVYQRMIRRGMEKVTWNFTSRRLTNSQVKTIFHIPQGSNARKTDSVTQAAGYNRPFWNRICKPLHSDFYLASSNGPSIHPIYDRPFTIREGCRLSGLPDTLSFDLKVSIKEVAKMIATAVPPAMGEIVSIALRCIE